MSNVPFTYTHQRKGGRYQIVGFAKPAGSLKSTGAQTLVIYQDVDSQVQYVREDLDFKLSFAILRDSPTPKDVEQVEGCCGQDCEFCPYR